MIDLALETPCPKCGYDPSDHRIDSFRHVATHDRADDMLLFQCPRCGWSWKMPCNDAEKPKVVKR